MHNFSTNAYIKHFKSETNYTKRKSRKIPCFQFKIEVNIYFTFVEKTLKDQKACKQNILSIYLLFQLSQEKILYFQSIAVISSYSIF